MKKVLLLAIGLSTGLCLGAQSSKVGGPHKADLTLSKKTILDGSHSNFYASATAVQRLTNPVSTQAVGLRFSSSYNGLTLLVSESHCLTANQALGAVMMTHRLSQDWPADANADSGYIEYSWTTNWGTSWDSSFVADQGVLGGKYFRYPNGAIINDPANTDTIKAVTVSSGPYTDGTHWKGYWHNDQQMGYAATQNTTVLTYGSVGVPSLAMPRIDFSSYDDTSAWGTASLCRNNDSISGFRGAALIKAQKNGLNVTWSYDSIKPSFHFPSVGDADAYSIAQLAFSADGKTGYCVFFGVDANATTVSTRSFLPIVYKSTNSGVSWTQLPIFDFTTIPAIANTLVPAHDSSGVKPWFSQDQGSDCIVDMNGQLHIICTITSGYTNNDDSLSTYYDYTGLDVNGIASNPRHYIFDTHTTATGWDSWLIGSIYTSTTTTTSQWTEPAGGSGALLTDARLQASTTADHSKIFYVWVDSPDELGNSAEAENDLPDLYGTAYDLTTGTYTTTMQFTTTQDFWWHFVSNVALTDNTNSEYKVGVTNSQCRAANSYNMDNQMDHYFYDGCVFPFDGFTNTVVSGIKENSSAVSFTTYPNPAHDMVNVNMNMTHSANVDITIVDALGQSVLAENKMLNEGANTVQLNTSALSKGVYFISVTSDKSKTTSKIVIQ